MSEAPSPRRRPRRRSTPDANQNGAKALVERRAFFKELLLHKPAGYPAYVWAKRGVAHYPLNPQDAAAKVDALGANPYVGVAFIHPDTRIPRRKRPSAEHAAGIYGVWLDLDVNGTPAGNGRVKTGVAPNRNEALKLASAIRPPTLIVDSGGGVHAWHLLEEPWLLDDEHDRKQAAELAARWQDAHRKRVPWQIDPTADLARVLRIPGTFNTKGEPPALVQLLQATGPRYPLQDLLDDVERVPRRPGAGARERERPSSGERVPHGGRHHHLKDFAVRLVRAGVTDKATILVHLWTEFHEFCDQDPAPEPGSIEALAKWAAESDIAGRERNSFGVTMNKVGRSGAEDAEDAGHSWRPLSAYTDLPEFPVEALPEEVAAWVKAEAEHSQTPVDLPALTALGVLSAAALGGPKVDCGTWREELTLYLLTALPSGDRKSTVLREATKPLRALERKRRERRAPSVRERQDRRETLELKRKNLKKTAASLEADPGKPSNAERELAEVGAELASIGHPVHYRLLADDATPEALAGLLASHDATEHDVKNARNPAEVPVEVNSGVFDIVFGPPKITLTPEASRLLTELREAIEPRLAVTGDLRPVAGWIARHHGRVASIAGLFHLCEHEIAEPIGEDTMRRALRIGTYFLAHAIAVLTGPDEEARRDLRWLEKRNKSPVTVRELYRGAGAHGEVEPWKERAEKLVALGALRALPTSRQQGAGRPPSPSYEVNPYLLASRPDRKDYEDDEAGYEAEGERRHRGTEVPQRVQVRQLHLAQDAEMVLPLGNTIESADENPRKHCGSDAVAAGNTLSRNTKPVRPRRVPRRVPGGAKRP